VAEKAQSEVGALGYRIVVDREKCQGIGACVGAAPDVFEIDREAKAIVIYAEGVDETIDETIKETIVLAAEACPLEAIRVYDDEGEQVYP